MLSASLIECTFSIIIVNSNSIVFNLIKLDMRGKSLTISELGVNCVYCVSLMR